MHILFAAPGYKPAFKIGGPIESVSSAAETLVRKGHRVTVFATNSNLTEDLDIETDKPFNVNGVEVWYFKRVEPFKKYFPFFTYMSKSLGFLYAPRMRYELEKIMPQVDLVHTHLPFTYPTYASGYAALRHGKPLFYSQRGVLDQESLKFRSWKKKLCIRFLELPLLKGADTLISLTEAEMASYYALGVKTRSEIIPNGINIDKYWQHVPDEWHDQLNIPKHAPVILYLGRLHPSKGTDRLIRAFLNIRSKFPEALLICAGPDEFNIQKKLQTIAGGDSAFNKILFPGMVSGDYKKSAACKSQSFLFAIECRRFFYYHTRGIGQ